MDAERQKKIPTATKKTSGKSRRRPADVAANKEEHKKVKARKTKFLPTQFNPINVNEYTDDEVEFMTAIQHYKTEYHRAFPTCCEVLGVLKSLGYRKAAKNGATSKHGK